MLKSALGALSLASLLLALTAASPAQAADDKFCHDYARDVIRLAKDAGDHPKCHDLLRDQDRWNADEHHHFDWCKHTDKREVIAALDARKHDLEKCKH